MIRPAPRMPSTPFTMYRAIVGIGMLCALLIVGVYAATASRIAQNQAVALRNAVTEVLPAAMTLRPIALMADGVIANQTDPAQGMPAFAGYDAEGTLVGVAITAAGMGYQDTIQVIYAYSFADSAIIGLHVLRSLETPGLGDKIETDSDFVANFTRLDVALDTDGAALAHAIETVSHGSKEHPWQIDAITGATVSSKAIGQILDSSAQQWVPLLVRQKQQLAQAPAAVED